MCSPIDPQPVTIRKTRTEQNNKQPQQQQKQHCKFLVCELLADAPPPEQNRTEQKQ
jgi:hypothetical protein